MPTKIERIFFLDALRSILMMLGVILHSALVYSPDQNWIVSSEETHIAFEIISTFIHWFRMPAFFVISGFFCIVSLRSYSTKYFLTSRFKRIVIPFFTTVFSLNLLQTFLLNKYTETPFNFAIHINSGAWLSHLWFLINVVFYFLLAFSLYFILRVLITERSLVQLKKLLSAKIKSQGMILIMFLLPFTTIAIFLLNKIGFPLYSSFIGINTYFIILYLPYFCIGCFLAVNTSFFKRFSSVNLKIYSLLSVALIIVYRQFYLIGDSALANVAEVYIEQLITWLLVALIFSISHKLFNSESRVWRYWASASYSVYLFHHVVVVCLAILLINAKVGAFMGFIILISFTYLVTFLIHQFGIRKSGILKYFYNGI